MLSGDFRRVKSHLSQRIGLLAVTFQHGGKAFSVESYILSQCPFSIIKTQAQHLTSRLQGSEGMQELAVNPNLSLANIKDIVNGSAVVAEDHSDLRLAIYLAKILRHNPAIENNLTGDLAANIERGRAALEAEIAEREAEAAAVLAEARRAHLEDALLLIRRGRGAELSCVDLVELLVSPDVTEADKAVIGDALIDSFNDEKGIAVLRRISIEDILAQIEGAERPELKTFWCMLLSELCVKKPERQDEAGGAGVDLLFSIVADLNDAPAELRVTALFVLYDLILDYPENTKHLCDKADALPSLVALMNDHGFGEKDTRVIRFILNYLSRDKARKAEIDAECDRQGVSLSETGLGFSVFNLVSSGTLFAAAMMAAKVYQQNWQAGPEDAATAIGIMIASAGTAWAQRKVAGGEASTTSFWCCGSDRREGRMPTGYDPELD